MDALRRVSFANVAVLRDMMIYDLRNIGVYVPKNMMVHQLTDDVRPAKEGLAGGMQTRTDVFALGIDCMRFDNVTSVAVASVTGAVGLADVTALHWIRKMMNHVEVRLPRGLPETVHRIRMSQTDLCYCSDQI